MIDLVVARRDNECAHSVSVIDDNRISVSMDEITEVFDLSVLDDEDTYELTDCLELLYNPIQFITKTPTGYRIMVFLDSYIPEICPFKKEAITYSQIGSLIELKSTVIKKLKDLSVTRNYDLLPAYTRDNIYAGEEACYGYPAYLIGDVGKQTIAKMNKFFKDTTKSEIQKIIAINKKKDIKIYLSSEYDPFPKTEAEMVALLNIAES